MLSACSKESTFIAEDVQSKEVQRLKIIFYEDDDEDFNFLQLDTIKLFVNMAGIITKEVSGL